MATPKKTTKKVTKKAATATEAAPETVAGAAATPKGKAKTEKAEKPAAASPATPAIDTAQHAQSAAAALLAARARGTLASVAAAQNESAAFKKLKQGLTQPSLSSNSPVAGGQASFQKPGHGGFNRQPLHRQAFNVNSNRTGVPRRTSGG